MSVQIIFYHTTDCHLCDVAEAMISPLLVVSGLVAEAIDVAEDLDAFERFGMKIPVLYFPQTDISVLWPFDENEVVRLFNEVGQAERRSTT